MALVDKGAFVILFEDINGKPQRRHRLPARVINKAEKKNRRFRFSLTNLCSEVIIIILCYVTSQVT